MTDGDLDGSEASTSSAISLDPTASYTLVGVQSNKCVGPVGGSTASSVQLEIETCTGTANQRWIPQPMSGGFFRLRNELSGLCMDVSGASLSPGAIVQQFTCGSQTNQQWSITDLADGSEHVAARHSGQVLDVTGFGTADGTRIQQWFASGNSNSSNQHFFMHEALPAIIVNINN